MAFALLTGCDSKKKTNKERQIGICGGKFRLSIWDLQGETYVIKQTIRWILSVVKIHEKKKLSSLCIERGFTSDIQKFSEWIGRVLCTNIF